MKTNLRTPNKGVPIPDEYIEQMRHYIPSIPFAFIRQLWLHNATPKEAMEQIKQTEK